MSFSFLSELKEGMSGGGSRGQGVEKQMNKTVVCHKDTHSVKYHIYISFRIDAGSLLHLTAYLILNRVPFILIIADSYLRYIFYYYQRGYLAKWS